MFDVFNGSDITILHEGKVIGKASSLDTTPKVSIENLGESKRLTPFKSASLEIKEAKVNKIALWEMMGYRIIEAEYLVELVQVKTHRKKRINKKWAKRYGFNHVPYSNLHVSGRMVIGHPETIKRMREALNNE